jgi:hypothetical protein
LAGVGSVSISILLLGPRQAVFHAQAAPLEEHDVHQVADLASLHQRAELVDEDLGGGVGGHAVALDLRKVLHGEVLLASWRSVSFPMLAKAALRPPIEELRPEGATLPEVSRDEGKQPPHFGDRGELPHVGVSRFPHQPPQQDRALVI